MSEYYLAVDIGASGGRHMLGTIRDGKLVLEEIYRFGNGMVNQDGKLLWDTGRLFWEIINGMKRCKERNKIRSVCRLTPGPWIMCCWMRRIGS